MIKTIFFDFDGVMTTDPNGRTAMIRNLSEKIPGVLPERITECFLKWNRDNKLGKLLFRDVWDEFCSCIGTDVSLDVLDYAFGTVRPNKKMFEYVKELKSSEYVTGVLTNNSSERIEALRTNYNLDSIFDHYILSAQVGSKKDEEEIFSHALKQSG